MKQLKTFGLPIEINEETSQFTFAPDVTVETSSGKPVSKMKGLLYSDSGVDGDQTVNYVFYNNVTRKQDAHLFSDRGYANGITVLMPGLVNGECRKNSGHFHEVEAGHTLPYPEAYEILCGEAIFMIQVCKNFHDYENGLKVDSVQAVFMKAGDKIVVPPYCAHVAINAGEDIMAFGNLCAVTHLNYAPIKAMHGLCYYVMKMNGSIVFVPNARYTGIPQLKVTEASECAELGMLRNTSLYEEFTADPNRFAYLDQPEKYADIIAAALQ